MKRMDEVFDLPLVGEMNCGEPYLGDAGFYFASFDDELSYGDGNGLHRAQHAAHAINHVDSLADALEDLMDWNVKNVWVDEHPAYDRAAKALAKYRGDK